MNAALELAPIDQSPKVSIYDPDAEIERRYDRWLSKTRSEGAAAVLTLATVIQAKQRAGWEAGVVATIRDYARSLLETVNGKQTMLDTLSPPDVAKQLKVGPAKVISWIRSGQLKAANVATGKRPRYVIQRDDLDRFLSNRQPDPPERKRRTVKTSSKRY